MNLLFAILAFFLSFIIAVITIPPIIRVARAKKLFDSFDERKIHTKAIPPLGGVAIFLGFILSTIITSDYCTFTNLKYIIASSTLMFFIGLKDDLVDISARKKFLVQVFSALLIISLGDVQLSNFHGLFGLHQVPNWIGLPASFFLVILMVNAINLVDGIDGLASGLVMLMGLTLGTWFLINDYMPYALLAFAMVGSLAAFFGFNVFGKTNKLFMGDNGSLVIGLLLSILVIMFNELNISPNPQWPITHAPAVSFAIVSLPLIDTLRVMSIRILQRKSPFSPDNNHLHHRWLGVVNKHIHASLIIVFANLCIIILAFALDSLMVNIHIQFLVIALSALIMTAVPTMILKSKKPAAEGKSTLAKSTSRGRGE